ncbi:MAG: hypothetical protein ABW123_01650 [Cystobacter sp.]
MKSAFKSASWRVATLPLLTGTAVLAREPAESDATAQQKPKQMPDKQMQAVLGASKELRAKPFWGGRGVYVSGMEQAPARAAGQA